MRRKLGLGLMWLGALSLVAGCSSMSPEKKKYCTIGAVTGALVGGGTAALVADQAGGKSRNYAIGVPIGVGVGALLGGLIGCAMAPAPQPEAPPPPPPPPPPPAPPPPPPPQKIVLRGVHFDFDKSVIRDVDKPVLDEAADTLKANPNVKVDVNGYCDVIGTVPYNLKLSQRRSEAVAGYLEDKGIAAGQLVPQGFGKTNFVATNKTSEGRAENRRVELIPLE